MKKQGIIFDMDGTLWDSSQGVAESWTVVVQRDHNKNRVITQEEIRQVMGKTMDKIAEIMFPELEEEPRMILMKRCCMEENEYLRIHGGILFPELESTLKTLQEKYHLYIVSNCQQGYIEAFLEHYGFDRYFEDIECFGNNGLRKGQNIKKVVERNGLTDAIYVGDIQGDYDATMEAGITFIHAKYGFGTIAQETAKVSEFAGLPKVVEEIFGE